jgi:hypothetical protein
MFSQNDIQVMKGLLECSHFGSQRFDLTGWLAK